MNVDTHVSSELHPENAVTAVGGKCEVSVNMTLNTVNGTGLEATIASPGSTYTWVDDYPYVWSM